MMVVVQRCQPYVIIFKIALTTQMNWYAVRTGYIRVIIPSYCSMKICSSNVSDLDTKISGLETYCALCQGFLWPNLIAIPRPWMFWLFFFFFLTKKSKRVCLDILMQECLLILSIYQLSFWAISWPTLIALFYLIGWPIDDLWILIKLLQAVGH